jgi:toxin ParE1/3/4
MADIELVPEVAEDVERIVQHLEKFLVPNPHKRIEEIIQAISVLEQNPLIGRPVDSYKRELVIGSGSHGYLALYTYVEDLDCVFVLAIKSQRELGFVEKA